MKGAYFHRKKDGTVCYRSKISYRGKSISLGTFCAEKEAAEAYRTAELLYSDKNMTVEKLSLARFVIPMTEIESESNTKSNLKSKMKSKHDASILSVKKTVYSPLPADKVVSILNHRDNGIYIKTPIYLRKGYFSYYLKDGTELKFDTDDLFYFSSHRILNRGGSLYVNDFGTQYRIVGRYGIHNFSVPGRDYLFANGDETDFRSSNIVIRNPYFGVFQKKENGTLTFETRIHINGDYIVGIYNSPEMAAIAYNKAADYAISHGFNKKFPQNFVESVTASQYATVYTDIRLSKNYTNYFESLGSQGKNRK